MRHPLSHVLPNVFFGQQKNDQLRHTSLQPNFHTDFKWVRTKKVEGYPIVYYFSQTREVLGEVWLVENYICVKTQLVNKHIPTYFEDRACFECILT